MCLIMSCRRYCEKSSYLPTSLSTPRTSDSLNSTVTVDSSDVFQSDFSKKCFKADLVYSFSTNTTPKHWNLPNIHIFIHTFYWACQGTCQIHFVVPLSQGSPRTLTPKRRISNALFSFKITPHNLRFWKYILQQRQNTFLLHGGIDDTFWWCKTGF